MANLQELVAAVVADGTVDATECATIREVVYADGKIDREECDAMFAINDACSEAVDNAPEWNELFAEVVSDYVLKDDVSPGVVDQEEGDYLAEKMAGDDTLDDAEGAALTHIYNNASNVESAKLNELNEIWKAHQAEVASATATESNTESAE